MIIYHPFKDANHCSYRIISLLYNSKIKVSEAQINFMDFYYLFPEQLNKINDWPRANSKLAKKLSDITDNYEQIENPRRIFFELKLLRKNTLAHLFSKGILSLSDDLLTLHEEKLPSKLIDTLESDAFRKSFEFITITSEIPKLKIKGNRGLKARTNLMEYRYD